jgi:hypothetical protein
VIFGNPACKFRDTWIFLANESAKQGHSFTLTSSIMPTLDPNNQLESFYKEDQRLCFYPSCGYSLLWAVMALEADVFVFADYSARSEASRGQFWRRIEENFVQNGQQLMLEKSTASSRVFRCGDKRGILFFSDNNEALTRIQQAKCSIRVFVGIRDGCSEGGNYECVHAEPFLTKLLALGHAPMTYITNHSVLLEDLERRRRMHHTAFKLRVLHDNRWAFVLKDVLVYPHTPSDASGPGLDDTNKLVVFAPYVGCGKTESGARGEVLSGEDLELLKLAPFRIQHHEGVIARYEVMKVCDMSANIFDG